MIKYKKLRRSHRAELSKLSCAICGMQGPNVVDHDHDTGYVRGVLCARCNIGEGATKHLELDRLASYRELHDSRIPRTIEEIDIGVKPLMDHYPDIWWEKLSSGDGRNIHQGKCKDSIYRYSKLLAWGENFQASRIKFI